MDLYKLKSECSKCTLCALHAARKNVVFGDGNSSAKIMFIGEAPGVNEDEAGLPFIGRGGKLLSELLSEIGLLRGEHIYITNMVKCRPPENRDPKQDEIKLCSDYLNTQISIIKPKIIVCVGRIAAKTLICKNFKMMSEHGKFTLIDDMNYTAILHPAAVLRNVNLKPLLKEDLILIKEKLRKLDC